MRYLLQLFMQYCNSKGLNPNVKYLFENDEFINWIYVNKKSVKLYKDYLDYLEIDLDNKIIAEIGKGKYDTLAQESIKMISEYAYTLKREPSSLVMFKNTPFIINKDKIIRTNDISMFLTHNPYCEQSIYDWHKIHNSKEYEICVGIYGKIYDKDKKEKIKMLERLSSKMDEDHEKTYDEIGDSYFCNIKSSRKVLKKNLIR